tara:strand:+ start:741 stop:1691 length:951 start_codon:yes stop_codon:yes gene_type:complete
VDKKKVLLVGDTCLDIFVEGKVARISPEAPVPIFSYSHEVSYVGCASNVAISLSRLGLDVDIISFLTDDINGKTIEKKLLNEGINIEYIIKSKTTPSIFTIEKKRIVSDSHHICRIDKEPHIKTLMGVIHPSFGKTFKKAIANNNYSYIVISDYAKGIINKESYSLIKKLSNVPIIIDPKPKNKTIYENAFLMKPNKKELIELINLEYDFENNNIGSLLSEIREYISTKKIKNFVVTDGINGSYLITKEKYIHFPSKKVEVFDVSGAGDSFLSALVFYFAEGNCIEDSIEFANTAASTTIIHSGTTPLIKEDLKII